MNRQTLQETKLHGTPGFPYVVYHGKIPQFIQSFPRHWHEEAELILVTRGQLRVTVWSEAFQLSEGDVVILLPHTVHSIGQIGMEQAEYFNIVFHFSIFGADPCFDKYGKPFLTHEKTVEPCAPSGSGLNEALKPLLRSLIGHRHSSYTTHECLVKSHLFMILHFLNQYAGDTKASERTLHQNCGRLNRAVYHIQNSYANEITVREAAELCGFSESHFMKLFRELTGRSFTDYLIHYRLEIAAEQLTGTELKIIEIAENCGFRSQSYFTRAFAAKYGITPCAYRKARR